MNWRNPTDEVPPDGSKVAVLLQHWKKEGHLSCEIFFGEVQHYIKDGKLMQVCAFNNDYIGAGSQEWVIWQDEEHEYQTAFVDMVNAWMYVQDFPLPTFLEHRT